MLPLHVGLCLPLPIPSSIIALPTQKLTIYLTLKLTTHMLPYPKTHQKLTTHMLPYPKTQQKTHNPHATLPFPKKHTCCETMSSPSKVVRWECGACAYTNEDAKRCIYLACQARHPVRYAIVAGAAVAATARTTRVDRCKQAHVAALATAAPPIAREAATSAYVAIGRAAPTAAYGPPAVAESAAMHPGRAPRLGRDSASVVACLVNTMVDIVGTSTSDRGCNCSHHTCCGMQLQVGSKVCFRQERLIYCKGQEEDVLAVYVVGDNMMTCKVGFLLHHLAVRANVYNGLYACIVSIYSDRSTNVLKKKGFW
jgi:hypothetical protein